MGFKKTYKFAFRSATIIALFNFCLFVFLSFVFNKSVDYLLLFISSLLIFLFSIVIIQFRVEKFIYKRIKKIYDEVSLLNSEDLNKSTITTNMETLSKEVEKFAKTKQTEIASLNERESYGREFLGTISHELKTPLFTVQGYLLTLIDGAINDKGIREKYLQRAEKGVERLVSIVEDLDMISKFESNELGLNINSFDLVELIQEVFDLLEMKSKKREIKLVFNKNYDVPVLVFGDVKRIEQVLTNLLVNSIKYGSINGTTTVSIEPYDDKKIIIKVSDNGEGIEKRYLPRLFERFYRIDQSRSRDQGGSGLGLSIVKHIVEAHNETVMVESEFGKGSEFSFTLKKVE